MIKVTEFYTSTGTAERWDESKLFDYEFRATALEFPSLQMVLRDRFGCGLPDSFLIEPQDYEKYLRPIASEIRGRRGLAVDVESDADERCWWFIEADEETLEKVHALLNKG